MPSLDLHPLTHPGLLLGPDDFAAIRAKTEAHPWAKAALDRLAGQADVDTDVRIDDRKGQWMHYYACDDDGTRLETVSDTEHRCPTCGRVYTGDPYDAVVIRNRHMANGHRAVALGIVGHVTGDAACLDRAREIVLGYADRYGDYPFSDREHRPRHRGGGKVFHTALNESNWLISMAWAYDLCAPAMTDGERRHACEDFLHPDANEVVRFTNLRIHNIQCWMNSAMGLAAICCGDGELAHHAIESETGLHRQLAEGILADGMWWECSWGYHFYTMQALWPLCEAVRTQGIDVYGDRYKGLFDAPVRFAFPGGILPPINDSGAGVRLPARCEPYEIAFARWRDPAHASVLGQMERTGLLALCFGEELPPSTAKEGPLHRSRSSVNFPSAGVAILRDADTDAVVTLDYGPHGGGHGHPDKLGLIYHFAGRVMAPDPGSIPYAIPLHQEWFKQTISHNTVLVDQRSQEPCEGRLTRFTPEGDLEAATGQKEQIASAVAPDAYPGIRCGRTVALLPGGILLDRFDVAAEEEHVYDWGWHNRGVVSFDLTMSGISGPIAEENGYPHIRSPHKAVADRPWSAAWTDGDAGVVLAFGPASGTEVYSGVGRGNPPSEELPMVLVRRRAEAATFAAALVPFRGTPPSVILDVSPSGPDVLYRLLLDGAEQSFTVPSPFDP